jgi:hypothetical protein
MRRHDHGRGMGLEMARGDGILLGRRRWRRLLVGVPLLHGLHVLVIAVGRAILLCVMVGRGVWVVMDGRMRLGRDVVVVLLLGLPATRHIRTGHHGRRARCCLHSRRWLESKRPTCEATEVPTIIQMRCRVARRLQARVDVRVGESRIAGSWYQDDMSAAQAARERGEGEARDV